MLDISHRAKSLIDAAFVCDVILPWTEYGKPELRRNTLPRFKKSGFNLVSLSLGSDKETADDIIDAIERAHADILSDPKLLAVTTASDIAQAVEEDKLAITFNVQGTEYLQGNLEWVESFVSRGICQTLLVYNHRNRVGGGCHDHEDFPLTDYGRKLVGEMNRTGMIIDCSHTGYRTSMDAIACSSQPVVFSHSNPLALWRHDRNIRDDQALACAERGGLVGVTGVGIYMGEDDASPARIFRHVDYWAELLGPQSVCLGLDYVYDYQDMQAYMQSVDSPPDGNYENMTAFFPPEHLLELVIQMQAAGYSESDIQGILGANYLRLVNRIWDSVDRAA